MLQIVIKVNFMTSNLNVIVIVRLIGIIIVCLVEIEIIMEVSSLL